MTEYVHPDNPFPVSDNFKQITPVLVNAAVETLAFVAAPVAGDSPDHLIVAVAHEWAIRMTGLGGEDNTHGLVWELSVHVARTMAAGVPFPPFDITSRCGDDECHIDHGAQVHVVNAFLAAARDGVHEEAVKAFVQYVSKDDADEWADSRVQYAAMLLVHIAQRVSEYRTNSVEELPSLG